MISLDTLKDQIFGYFVPSLHPIIKVKYFIYNRLDSLLKKIYSDVTIIRVVDRRESVIRIRLHLDENVHYNTKYCEMIFKLDSNSINQFMYYNEHGILTEKYYYGKWEKTQVIKFLRIPKLDI